MAISIGFVGYQQSVVVPITVYPQDDFFRDFFFNLRELTMFIHGLITQDRSVLKLPSNMSRAGMYICSP
jgi:hypothetical protein